MKLHDVNRGVTSTNAAAGSAVVLARGTARHPAEAIKARDPGQVTLAN